MIFTFNNPDKPRFFLIQEIANTPKEHNCHSPVPVHKVANPDLKFFPLRAKSTPTFRENCIFYTVLPISAILTGVDSVTERVGCPTICSSASLTEQKLNKEFKSTVASQKRAQNTTKNTFC